MPVLRNGTMFRKYLQEIDTLAFFIKVLNNIFYIPKLALFYYAGISPTIPSFSCRGMKR